MSALSRPRNELWPGPGNRMRQILSGHVFSPRDPEVLHKFAGRFPATKTFRVGDALGGWAKLLANHFADGAIYDQIVVKR